MAFPNWFQRYYQDKYQNSSYVQVLLYQPLVKGGTLNPPRFTHRPDRINPPYSVNPVKVATAKDSDGKTDKNGDVSWANARAETKTTITDSPDEVVCRVDHYASSRISCRPGFEGLTASSGTAVAESTWWLNDLDPTPATEQLWEGEMWLRCIGHGDHRGGSVRKQKIACRFSPYFYLSATYSEDVETGKGVANGGWIIRAYYRDSPDPDDSVKYLQDVHPGQDLDVRLKVYAFHPKGYPFHISAHMNETREPHTLTTWAEKGLNMIAGDPLNDTPGFESKRFESMRILSEVKLLSVTDVD